MRRLDACLDFILIVAIGRCGRIFHELRVTYYGGPQGVLQRTKYSENADALRAEL